jgi:hypothetical protein
MLTIKDLERINRIVGLVRNKLHDYFDNEDYKVEVYYFRSEQRVDITFTAFEMELQFTVFDEKIKSEEVWLFSKYKIDGDKFQENDAETTFDKLDDFDLVTFIGDKD